MVIILMGMITAISLAVLQMVASENILSTREIRQQQIAQIAEAGINYYRWHLAHYPTDYKDGQTGAGPYAHDFKDTTGKVIGRYELTITAPPTGSTITTVRSSGYLLTYPNARHSITARLGIPSLSQYAVVANAFMNFGSGTEIFGPIMSNGGIHFDGIAHGLVSSAQSTYSDPDGNGTKPGVWSDNSDTTTFLGGKQYPVSAIDFAGITVNLAQLQTAAGANGILLPPSLGLGYHLVLRSDGKVDIYIVNTQQSCQYRTSLNGYCSGKTSKTCNTTTACTGTQGTCVYDWHDYGYCSNDYNTICTQDANCSGSGTCVNASHSIGTNNGDQVSFMYNGASSLGVPLPANGVIYAKDDVWVDGMVNNSRVTIVAAKDPPQSGNANIYLEHNLLYTNHDGRDVVGLIAQSNILASYFSDDDLKVEAALIAQNGRVGRPYFGIYNAFGGSNTTNNNYFQISPVGEKNPINTTSCQEYRKRTALTLNGSMATNQRYGFAWSSGVSNDTFSCSGGLKNDSGYCIRNLLFDANLVYSPPPLFPTSGQYSVLSFTEQ